MLLRAFLRIFTIVQEKRVVSSNHGDAKSFSKRTNSRLRRCKLRALKRDQMDRCIIFFHEVMSPRIIDNFSFLRLCSSVYVHVGTTKRCRAKSRARELLPVCVTRHRRSIVANVNFPRQMDDHRVALSIATGSGRHRFPRRVISFELSRFARPRIRNLSFRVSHSLAR